VTVKDVLPGGLLYAGTPLTTVAEATIVSGGSGYATAPTVAFTGGGGSGAAGTALLDGSGHVNGIFVTNPGPHYSSAPTIGLSGTGVAHYVITVQNPLVSGTATSVVVKDNLPSGFTYKNGSTLINGVASADPCSSCTVPSWSGVALNIAAGSSLTIAFDTNVG